MEDWKQLWERLLEAQEPQRELEEFIVAGFVAKEEYEQLSAQCSRYQQQVAEGEKERALDRAILQAKGKNPKAIKALLNLEGVMLNQDGVLEGLDLEALKQSDGYLFDQEAVFTKGTGYTKGASKAELGIGSEIAKAMGIKY